MPHERIGGFIWAESPDWKLWMEHVTDAGLVLGTIHFEIADRGQIPPQELSNAKLVKLRPTGLTKQYQQIVVAIPLMTFPVSILGFLQAICPTISESRRHLSHHMWISKE